MAAVLHLVLSAIHLAHCVPVIAGFGSAIGFLLARERLEADGDLPPWPVHDDGSRWVWWAEEAEETKVS
jgi:hypothetical protein